MSETIETQAQIINIPSDVYIERNGAQVSEKTAVCDGDIFTIISSTPYFGQEVFVIEGRKNETLFEKDFGITLDIEEGSSFRKTVSVGVEELSGVYSAYIKAQWNLGNDIDRIALLRQYYNENQLNGIVFRYENKFYKGTTSNYDFGEIDTVDAGPRPTGETTLTCNRKQFPEGIPPFVRGHSVKVWDDEMKIATIELENATVVLGLVTDK